MDTKWGFGIRMALLTAPVIIYPVSAIFINGPFIGKTFKWRYDVDEELPKHLKDLVDQVCFKEEFRDFMKILINF